VKTHGITGTAARKLNARAASHHSDVLAEERRALS
jgi:hypothetical protein